MSAERTQHFMGGRQGGGWKNGKKYALQTFLYFTSFRISGCNLLFSIFYFEIIILQ